MEKLIRILTELHPDVDFYAEQTLVEDGILDSLDIVSIVSQIDVEFGVSVPPEEIIPENFNSALALFEMITRLDEE